MAENPKQAEAAELHQRSVELWLGGRHDEAIAVYRQALGLESDAISLQLRDTLPNSYSDPDATPDAPINLLQQSPLKYPIKEPPLNRQTMSHFSISYRRL